MSSIKNKDGGKFKICGGKYAKKSRKIYGK